MIKLLLVMILSFPGNFGIANTHLFEPGNLASTVAAITETFTQAFNETILTRASSFDSFKHTGAVGELVTAALQTKGLIDHAKILSDFQKPLETLAALAWLFALVLAVGGTALFGNHKGAVYLLIGPPLFYWMVQTTVRTQGTELRVGKRTMSLSQADQRSFLHKVKLIEDDVGNEKEVNISFFFGLFDSVVSEAVQSIVGVLVKTENRDDIRFVVREQIFSYVLQGLPQDADEVRLISELHLGACAELVKEQYAVGVQTFREGQMPTPDVETSLRRLDSRWERPIPVQLDSSIKGYLLKMKQSNVEEFKNVRINNADEPYMPPPSCSEIWRWVKGALLRIAKERLDPSSRGTGGDPDFNAALQQGYSDVVKLFTSNGTSRPIDDPAVPMATKLNAAEGMLAAFLYSNAVRQTTHGALQGQIFGRVLFNAQNFETLVDNLGAVESKGGFFQLKYFAGAVKYIQGLLLYLLSIGFPFFALFLVMPGRATSFFLWCGMWAWVKSWDVGFALIHVSRDVLWHLLGGRINSGELRLDWSDPWRIVSIISHNDPLASLNVYWQISCLLTLAVPFLTAHLFLGASGAFEIFKPAILDMASNMKTTSVQALRREASDDIERYQLAGMEEYAIRHATRAAIGQMRGEGAEGGFTARTLSGREFGPMASPEVGDFLYQQHMLAEMRKNGVTGETLQNQQNTVNQMRDNLQRNWDSLGVANWYNGIGPAAAAVQNKQEYTRAKIEMMHATPEWAKVMEHAEARQFAILKNDQAAVEAEDKWLAKYADGGDKDAKRVEAAKTFAEAYSGMAPLYTDKDARENILEGAKLQENLAVNLAALTGRTQAEHVERMWQSTKAGTAGPTALMYERMGVDLKARGRAAGAHWANNTPRMELIFEALGMPPDSYSPLRPGGVEPTKPGGGG